MSNGIYTDVGRQWLIPYELGIVMGLRPWENVVGKGDKAHTIGAVYLARMPDGEPLAERAQREVERRMARAFAEYAAEKYDLPLRALSHHRAGAIGTGPMYVGTKAKGDTLIMGHVVERDAEDAWKNEDSGLARYAELEATVAMAAHEIERCIVVSLLDGELRDWPVTFQPTIAKLYYQEASKFIEQCTHRRRPNADGTVAMNKVLAKAFPANRSGVLKDPGPEANALARDYLAHKAAIDKHSVDLAVAEQRLKELIGADLGFLGEDWKVTWGLRDAGNPQWKQIAIALAGKKGVPEKIVEKYTSPPFRRFFLTTKR